jgi:hypothetical protein
MRSFSLFLASLFILSATKAQLANTTWQGLIKGDAPRRVLLEFKKDSLNMMGVADSAVQEKMMCAVRGNSFLLFKVSGVSDCDNTTPGKYQFEIKKDSLFITLISDKCDDRSSAINGTKFIRWRKHVEVRVDESILRQYVGEYASEDQHHFFITLEKGRLYIEGPNNNLPKSPLSPQSNTKLFLPVAGVEFDFIRDSNGKVTKFISHEEKDYELKKIK